MTITFPTFCGVCVQYALCAEKLLGSIKAESAEAAEQLLEDGKRSPACANFILGTPVHIEVKEVQQ